MICTKAVYRALLIPVCRWLVVAILLQAAPLSAEQIHVRYPEGTIHGFVALRALDGKLCKKPADTKVSVVEQGAPKTLARVLPRLSKLHHEAC
jgi:hypothetical protein